MRTKHDHFLRILGPKARIAALQREVAVLRQIGFIRLGTARIARLQKRLGIDGCDGASGTKARRALFAALFMTVVTVVPPTAIGQSLPSSSDADISGGLLPLEFIISRRLVGQFFPEIVQTTSTGRDETAVGKPEATRAAIYANADGTKLVTVTVNRYPTVDDAAAAYREALDKSEAARGFGPISLRLNVGKQSFAGTATKDGETHLGLGALDGRLIVGATLAGFDATPDALINLVALARAEDAAANSAAGR
jgi:hypothetical protein